MAVRSSLYFMFDNVSSQDFGILNVNVQTGLYQEQFLGERQIKEIVIKGRKKPYFQRVVDNPMELKLQLAIDDTTWDSTKMRDIARWLSQNDTDYPIYKPMYFSDNPDQIYMCMYSGAPQIYHNGAGQSYIEITMRCDAPYTYSPEYISDIYDFSDNSSAGSSIQFDNLGDMILKPEMWITKIGDNNGDVSIINTSNKGTNTQFNGATKYTGTITFTGNVSDGETVTIGDDVYEFDTNNQTTSGNIVVNVSTDQTPSGATNALVASINQHKTANITVTSTSVSPYQIVVTYNQSGSVGEINTVTTCANANWGGNTTLTGVDGLLDQEQVYVNNDDDEIISSLEDTEDVYRYDAFNDNYLELVRGRNYLQVYGNCKIQFRYKFKTVQG